MDQPVNEVWRSIDGFINYQASNVGRVRMAKSGRLLIPMANLKGYLFVRLRNCEGVRKSKTSHRLVAQEFLSNSNNKPCVDHISRDRKNNAITNLRWATWSDNSANKTKRQETTSKYVSMGWDSGKRKWHARVHVDGRMYHLGYFESEDDAAMAYDEHAKVVHGEFATLNFPGT